jgi:hypothetical protein
MDPARSESQIEDHIPKDLCLGLIRRLETKGNTCPQCGVRELPKQQASGS